MTVRKKVVNINLQNMKYGRKRGTQNDKHGKNDNKNKSIQFCTDTTAAPALITVLSFNKKHTLLGSVQTNKHPQQKEASFNV